MFTYKLPYTTIVSRKELDTSTLSDLSGDFPGGLLSLTTVHKIGRKQSWLLDYNEYYYVPSLGLVKAHNWKDYLPTEFLQFKKTITQVCVELSVSRAFAKFLKSSSSYLAHIESPKYKHLLGILNHSEHTNYGEITNTRKSDRIRIIDKREVSLSRVNSILTRFNATLQEPWEGTRNKDGSVRFYHVKCNVCNTIYSTYLHARDMRVCPFCKQGKFSAVREGVMKAFIESFGITVYQSYRQLIKNEQGLPMELDLYLPEYNIAFEFNGYRYHNSTGDNPKSKWYHSYKTKACLSKGVLLYHIWSDTPDALCKSIIMSKLNKSQRIFARKCTIGPSTSEFLKQNHVDGDCRALKRWSLHFNNEEVCQLSVRKHSEGLEIARFASKQGITVVGGYSRLLSYVKKWAQENGYRRIISYCNRDLSPDYRKTFYYKQGFSLISESSLILKYTNYNPVELNGVFYKSNSVIARQRCQKHLLMKELGIKETTKTEAELAASLGIYQVYNSGNWKFAIDL